MPEASFFLFRIFQFQKALRNENSLDFLVILSKFASVPSLLSDFVSLNLLLCRNHSVMCQDKRTMKTKAKRLITHASKQRCKLAAASIINKDIE